MFLRLMPSNLDATYASRRVKRLGGLFEGLHDLGRNELVRRLETLNIFSGFELVLGFTLQVLIGTTGKVITRQHAGTKIEVSQAFFLALVVVDINLEAVLSVLIAASVVGLNDIQQETVFI